MYLNNLYNVTGRFGRDPELQTRPEGSVSNFSIAVDTGKDKDGNNKDPMWVDCYCWHKKAELIYEWFKKGDLIHIIGPIEQRSYINKDSVKVDKWRVEVKEFSFVPRNKSADDQAS